MRTTILQIIYNLLGAISLGNGLWMLGAASSWFFKMPIAAHDTGPLNAHFVHDVGWVYVLVGVAAFYCSRHLENCFEIHVAAVLFMLGHAFIHAVEIVIGTLPTAHWLIDFPLVTFPALLLLAITPFLHQLNYHGTEKK